MSRSEPSRQVCSKSFHEKVLTETSASAPRLNSEDPATAYRIGIHGNRPLHTTELARVSPLRLSRLEPYFSPASTLPALLESASDAMQIGEDTGMPYKSSEHTHSLFRTNNRYRWDGYSIDLLLEAAGVINEIHAREEEREKQKRKVRRGG